MSRKSVVFKKVGAAVAIVALTALIAGCSKDKKNAAPIQVPSTTTTAVKGSTTTTLPVQVAGESLPDGEVYGFLHDVDPVKNTITMDPVSFYTDAEALTHLSADGIIPDVKAKIEENIGGIEGSTTSENDFFVYVNNPDSKLGVASVDPSLSMNWTIDVLDTASGNYNSTSGVANLTQLSAAAKASTGLGAIPPAGQLQLDPISIVTGTIIEATVANGKATALKIWDDHDRSTQRQIVISNPYMLDGSEEAKAALAKPLPDGSYFATKVKFDQASGLFNMSFRPMELLGVAFDGDANYVSPVQYTVPFSPTCEYEVSATGGPQNVVSHDAFLTQLATGAPDGQGGSSKVSLDFDIEIAGGQIAYISNIKYA